MLSFVKHSLFHGRVIDHKIGKEGRVYESGKAS
jgi:hypothetical protein